jgi:hypothetical protein
MLMTNGAFAQLLGEAANRHKLSRFQGMVFREYASERFPDADPLYIDEWASRFAAGIAYVTSDAHGQLVLNQLMHKHREAF